MLAARDASERLLLIPDLWPGLYAHVLHQPVGGSSSYVRSPALGCTPPSPRPFIIAGLW